MADEIIYNIKVEGAEAATANLGRLEAMLKQINKERSELINKQANGNKLTTEEQKRLTALTARQASLSQSRREAARIINTQARASQTLNSAYQQMQIRLTQARNKYRDLAIQNKQNTKEGRALLANIQRQDAALRRVDASMGQHQRNVGNYGSALKNVGSQLMGALGLTAGIAGLVKVFKDIINTSKDFEKQTATLAGVLDVTIEQTKQLTNQAIRLGGAYPTLAKEVLNLQTAYARLGFTQEQILKLTEPTIKGSFALNAELGDTAELVGAVVKSYDELGAVDAGNIIDKLTKSTQRSSLNFEALKTALPKVAGAANALNIPLNETLALLGTSIDATQDASIAGTSLRKIMLSNAAANRDLSDGLDIINASTNKVSTAQKLYGDRAAVVALALANQQEKTISLSDEINNSLGVATRTAEKQMNTLAGSIDGVSSAWEKFVLSSSDTGVLKDIADGAAAAINTMTDLPDAGVTGTTAGAAILSFFGFGQKAKKRIEKEITEEYDYLRSLSINQLNEIIPQQEKIIQSYHDEGRAYEVRKETEKLEYIKGLINERTELEANAAKLKAEKLQAEFDKDNADRLIALDEAAKKEMERRKAIEQSYIDFAKEAENDLSIRTIDLKDKAEKIDEEYLDREIKRRTDATLNYIKQLEEQNKALDEREKREKDYNDRIQDIYHDTAGAIGYEFGNMLTNTENTFKDFSKNMLIIMLDSLQRSLFIYLAQLTAKELATKGFPFGLATTAIGTGIITAAFSAAKGAVSSFAKGGIIGGNLHSSGGTQFVGSDGSRFEAERGELLTIVNRHDTERLSMLSNINSKHGRAFYAAGGVHVPGPMAGSGIDRGALREIVNETVRGIGAIPVVVSESDITTAQKSARIVKTKGDY